MKFELPRIRLIRIYYLKGDKEITDGFSAENEWITSVYSFLKNIPDYFHIQTFEETEVVKVSLNDLETCFIDFPEIKLRTCITYNFVTKPLAIIYLNIISRFKV